MASPARERMPKAGLAALSAAIFVSMTIEFLPGGLIPKIALDYGRSASEVGQLVTLFALTVVLTATPLAFVTRRLSRKLVVLVASGLICVTVAATALAPTFEVMLVARVLGGLAHGLFWSVVATYPAHLVGRQTLARALAVTAAGGSVAGVAGMPIGNALGQVFGWRAAFGVFAFLAAVIVVLLASLLPSVSRPNAAPGKAACRSTAPDRTVPAILMVCLLILLLVSSQTSFGTYLVVWLEDVVNFSSAAIPVVLFLMGVSGAVGTALVGVFYARQPRMIFSVAVMTLIGLLGSLPLAADMKSSTIVLIVILMMAAVFGGVPVMLQTRMMWTASPATRNLAGSLQTTAFNVGIGGGAFFGGKVIEAEFAETRGIEVLPYWAAAAMLVGLLVSISWDRHLRRSNDN